MMPVCTYTDHGDRRELAACLEADGEWFAVLLDMAQGRDDKALMKGALMEIMYRVFVSLTHPKAQAVADWLSAALQDWHCADSYAALVTCGLLKQGAKQTRDLMQEQAPARCAALVAMADALHVAVKDETAAE